MSMALELVKRVEKLERIVAKQWAIIAEKDAEIQRLNCVIDGLHCVIDGLNEKVALLERKLNTNSSNSSKPPSSDPAWKTPKKTKNSGNRQ